MLSARDIDMTQILSLPTRERNSDLGMWERLGLLIMRFLLCLILYQGSPLRVTSYSSFTDEDTEALKANLPEDAHTLLGPQVPCL